MTPGNPVPHRHRYEKHDVFDTPEDAVPLSRYMDLAKYLSLLEERSLFFCRMDSLGDPFEGSWPRLHPEMLRERVREEHRLYEQLKERERGDVESVVQFFRYENLILRSVSGASCWHEGEKESAALWHVYAAMDSGICVRTSTGRLKRSLESASAPEAKYPFFLGRVRYIDYETDRIQGGANTLWPLIYKRSSFEHEREVRAIIVDWERHEDAHEKGPELGGLSSGGLAASIDVGVLVEEVLVAPESPGWFVRVVEETTRRLGFTFPVRLSKMAAKPFL